MKKITTKYNINQCALYKCRNKRRLADLLFVNPRTLDKIVKNTNYYNFSLKKKDGGNRTITAPYNELKKIQRRILELLVRVERPNWLISGERGKCYIDNGKAHQNSLYMLTVDIKTFYDNCKRERVFRFFKDYLNTSSDIAGLLTDIVTLQGVIPTGCPTSQLIAYYAYQEMFHNISKISQSHGCIFTLYVDDMTFSSQVPFDPKKLLKNIDLELRKFGHKPNYKKAKYYSRQEFKPVTGTIVSSKNELLVPNNLMQKIFCGFKDLKASRGKTNCTERNKTLLTLKGQLQAAKNIDSSIFPEINRLASNGYLE